METTEADFTSLDRRYSCRARYGRPDRYRGLLSLDPAGRYIARGAGISYVAASFGTEAASVCLESFDRILAFDAAAGLIEVEAGISIGGLQSFLAGKGYTLPVQPGHPQITVGGCIALNIHGKNQFREGLFADHVREIGLYHPDKGLLRLAADENPDIFELTCGGFGLTGVIVRAILRVKPLPSPMVRTWNVPTASLRGTFAALQKLEAGCDMMHAWIDLSRPSRGGVRGFVACAAFTPAPRPYRASSRAVLLTRRARPLIFSRLNRFSIPLINAGYFFLNTWLSGETIRPLEEFAYPAAGLSFYFDLFGRKGFVERQMLIPQAHLDPYADAFEALWRRQRPPVALATAKLFRGGGRLLNFAGTGASLTLDVAGKDENRAFHEELDALNRRWAVLDNPAKDSRLSRETAAAEYPGFGPFRARLRAFDPERKFRSEVSERLGL